MFVYLPSSVSLAFMVQLSTMPATPAVVVDINWTVISEATPADLSRDDDPVLFQEREEELGRQC